MAENLDAQCPICYGEFAETGGHVPRLLPCSHTFCDTCIRAWLRGRPALVCPECRQRHPAPHGPRSFPQNKYVLNYVRIKKKDERKADKRETTPQKQQDKKQETTQNDDQNSGMQKCVKKYYVPPQRSRSGKT